jgi:phosphatidylglycerophosphate synthase
MPSTAQTRRLRVRLALAGGTTTSVAAIVGALSVAAVGGDPVGAAIRSAVVLAAWLAWSLRSAHLHSGDTLGLAVVITLARGVLVGVLAAFFMVPVALVPSTALAGVGLVALALDGVDGAVARRMGRASDFGGTLDMELDAWTVLLLSAMAWWLGRAGPWVLTAGLLRYAALAAGALHPTFRRPLDARPARRVVAGLAVGGLSVCLAAPLDGWPATALAATVVVLLVHSFGRDAAIQWRSP